MPKSIQNTHRRQPRKALIDGTLLTGATIKNDLLILYLHEDWHLPKPHRAARKVFYEIGRDRSAFRNRYKVLGSTANQLMLLILDNKQATAEDHLNFIQAQARVTPANVLSEIRAGKLIVKAHKSQSHITLELDPNLSHEDIYNVNVSLYNKRRTSKLFQYYFGVPCKNHGWPRMALTKNSLPLSEQALMDVFNRVCGKLDTSLSQSYLPLYQGFAYAGFMMPKPILSTEEQERRKRATASWNGIL